MVLNTTERSSRLNKAPWSLFSFLGIHLLDNQNHFHAKSGQETGLIQEKLPSFHPLKPPEQKVNCLSLMIDQIEQQYSTFFIPQHTDQAIAENHWLKITGLEPSPSIHPSLQTTIGKICTDSALHAPTNCTTKIAES